MQPYKYVPSLCKDEKSGITGFVMLKPRSIPEKYRLMASCELKLDAENVPLGGTANLNAIASAIELSEKYYKAVEIKRGEKEHKTFAELIHDDKCDGLVTEVAMHVISSATVGES